MAADDTAVEHRDSQWHEVSCECIRHLSLNQLRSSFEKQWRHHFACKAGKEVFNSWMFEELASKDGGESSNRCRSEFAVSTNMLSTD